jgi:hypothetical protein
MTLTFLKLYRFQDSQLEKQEVRAVAMRQRFQERTQRFLNAKQRTIGIDKEFLDQQVNEKNMVYEEERNKSILEGKFKMHHPKIVWRKTQQIAHSLKSCSRSLPPTYHLFSAEHIQQVCEYMEQKELEKQKIQFELQQEINETLAHQASQPKNNALGKGEPLDLDKCGPSSLQRFGGEDNMFSERKKMQQQQLRHWCSQGFRERSDKYNDEKEKENEYAKCVVEEDRVRCEVALDEERQRRELEVSVMIENKVMAEQRRKRHADVKRVRINAEKNVTASPFLCEDTEYSESAAFGHHVRPDHFKGFPADKLQSIVADNDRVVKEREFLHQEEIRRKEEWVELQNRMISQTEELEQKKLKIRDEDNKVHVQTLHLQREELREKREQMEKDRFGDVGNGFFQKFGTSCR